MTRHPIYLTLCVLSAAYLIIADARAWSFWQSMVARTSPSGWGRGSSFHHK